MLIALLMQLQRPRAFPKLFGREPRAKALSKANRLRSSITDKAPQRAPLPSLSDAKLALCSGAKGLSLSVDSGAYAASAPKDVPKVLSPKLELKHYLVLITSAVMKRTGRHSMCNPIEPLCWIV